MLHKRKSILFSLIFKFSIFFQTEKKYREKKIILERKLNDKV